MADANRYATLAGLKARPELNGRRVRLLKWNAAKQRWAVEVLYNNKELMARTENLQMDRHNGEDLPSSLQWNGVDVNSAIFEPPCKPIDALGCLQALTDEEQSLQGQAVATACLRTISMELNCIGELNCSTGELNSSDGTSELAHQLTEAGAVHAISRLLSDNILAEVLRRQGTLCLAGLWRWSKLAREREESAGGMEAVLCALSADTYDTLCVSNAIEALAERFCARAGRTFKQEMGERCLRMRLPNAMAAAGTPGSEDVLTLLTRILRIFWREADHEGAIARGLAEDHRISREKVVAACLRVLACLPWSESYALPLYQSLLEGGALTTVLEILSARRNEPQYKPGTTDTGTVKTLATLVLNWMLGATRNRFGENSPRPDLIKLPDPVKKALREQARTDCLRLQLPIPELLSEQPLPTRRKVSFGDRGAETGDAKKIVAPEGSDASKTTEPASTIIVGLKSRAELNGTKVAVHSYDLRKRRFAVTLTDRGNLEVASDNLTAASERAESLLVRCANLQSSKQDAASSLALAQHLRALVLTSFDALDPSRPPPSARQLIDVHLKAHPMDPASLNQELLFNGSFQRQFSDEEIASLVQKHLSASVCHAMLMCNPEDLSRLKHALAFFTEHGGPAAMAAALRPADLANRELAGFACTVFYLPWSALRFSDSWNTNEYDPLPSRSLGAAGSAGWVGVVQRVLEAIEQHADDATIVKEGLSVITALCRTLDATSAAGDPVQLQAALDRKREFGRAGGSDAVIRVLNAALRLHTGMGNVPLFFNGCFALGAVFDTDASLPVWRELAPQQATPGLAEIVVRMLEKHCLPLIDKKQVPPSMWIPFATIGCLALQNVCHGDSLASKELALIIAKSRELAVAAGAIGTLVRILRACTPLLSPDVRRKEGDGLSSVHAASNACRALANIAHSDNDHDIQCYERPLARRLADEGGMTALVEALRSAHEEGNHESSPIAEAGMNALVSTLSGSPHALSLALRTGAIAVGDRRAVLQSYPGIQVQPPQTSIPAEQLAGNVRGRYYVVFSHTHAMVLGVQ